MRIQKEGVPTLMVTSPVNENIGQLIKRLREQHRLSISQLAAQTGLSGNAIRWIERGVTQPKPESLRALAGALSISYQEFLSKAGYLADDDLINEETKRLVEVYRELSPQARQVLQEVLKALSALTEVPLQEG